ncbi:MAG: efflux RND transporter permease subunit, partial [Alphaproteobacteria bacterium]|nr:efflux RND transporter permease subunit [Alphaproteobacteria bacterium]
MKAIIDAALARSRPVLATLALILIAGVYAYIDIAKESDPDVEIPILYVSMRHDGISPEDAERLLVRPMEIELRSIEGLKEMRSTALEGFASVLLEFEAGFDADAAVAEVRKQVDIAKAELPEETDDPVINEVNVGLFPVLVITLSGDVPERTLVAVARDLRDTLQSLPGVLSADLAGTREEVLEAVVDPLRLESYEVSPQALVTAVTLNNRVVPAGAIDTGAGRFNIKVSGLFETAKDVLELPIKVSGDGVVTLADVSDIRRTFKDADSYARIGGAPSVAIEIRKRPGENIIETIADVQRAVAEDRQLWPPGVAVSYSQDRSSDIRNMLRDLQNSIIAAVLLVMIIVVAALGLRSGLIVGVSIPGSFLLGILYLYAFGFTMNIVVLFSLILAVGMLVDGAVIVVEFADRRMAEGMARRDAYAEAAKRMGWPVITSTLTTIAAFLPLLFWPGVVGEFMLFLPITLIMTLAASLLMALVFVPSLGALFGRPGAVDPADLRSLAAIERGDLRLVRGGTGVYIRVMQAVVRRPVLVLAASIASLVAVFFYYGENNAGVEFFPNVEPESAIVLVHARGNLSIDEKDALLREVEERILDLTDFATVYTRVGRAAEGQEQGEDVIGTITLEFKDWQERRPAATVIADMRERTADLAGILVEVREPEAGPPTGKPIQLQLTSRLPDLLPAAAATIRSHLETMAGLVDVEDSRPMPGIDWELKVDRAQAGRFGADIVSVGNVVQLVTAGIQVGEYRPDDSDDEVEIRVRYPLDARNLDQLGQLRVPTREGLVPIGNFVSREARPRVGTIERADGQRKLVVQANVVEGVLPAAKVEEISAWLKTADIDPRIDIAFKGEDEEQRKAADFLTKAFAVALFLIAIIIVTQFNSFYQTLLILSAVMMSTIGAFLGLIVMNQPFGIVMTGIGFITLAGVVVNNNIVLIDTFNVLRRSGMDPMEAVIRTGAQRIRPVLLTAVTAAFGLLPMMLQLNIDFVAREVSVGGPSTQWWVQLATAVVFGLSFATLLTLVVTPSLLALGVQVGQRRERRRARRAERRHT